MSTNSNSKEKWINILPLIQNVINNNEDSNCTTSTHKPLATPQVQPQPQPFITSKNPICSVNDLSLFDTMNAVEIMDIRMVCIYVYYEQCIIVS